MVGVYFMCISLLKSIFTFQGFAAHFFSFVKPFLYFFQIYSPYTFNLMALHALGISTKTGYHLLRENRIEHLKVGRSYRIPKAHLLAYLRLDVKTASHP